MHVYCEHEQLEYIGIILLNDIYSLVRLSVSMVGIDCDRQPAYHLNDM